MDLHLKGKKALITAASYGLGFACAKMLAEEGADVVISARTADKLKQAADEITKISGGKVGYYCADLQKSDDIKGLFSYTDEFLGAIDILVANTGHPPTMPFSATNDEDWQLGIDLVLKSAIQMSRQALKGMRKQKYGRIIFIGSIFGLEPEKSSVIQSTLRTGLNALAKCMASESAKDGVTVNVVCPGYFDTPLLRNLAKQYAEQERVSVDQVMEYWKQQSPANRYGKPEDLAAMIAFLSSPRGEFITGTAIVMDGGALKSY